jgi:hypothetical protein
MVRDTPRLNTRRADFLLSAVDVVDKCEVPYDAVTV